MTPEQLAKSNTEAAHQRAFLQQCALNRGLYPCLKWIYHIPNGGSRGADAATASRNGAEMRALGVRRGVCDLHLPVPAGKYASLYIEMKKPSGGSLSPDQIEFIAFAQQHHNAVVVCRTWLEAWHATVGYLSGDFRIGSDLSPV